MEVYPQNTIVVYTNSLSLICLYHYTPMICTQYPGLLHRHDRAMESSHGFGSECDSPPPKWRWDEWRWAAGTMFFYVTFLCVVSRAEMNSADLDRQLEMSAVGDHVHHTSPNSPKRTDGEAQ